MDRTTVSGTVGAGSIPAGGAIRSETPCLAANRSSTLCVCGTCSKVFLRLTVVRKTWGNVLLHTVRNLQQGVFSLNRCAINRLSDAKQPFL